MSFSLWTVFAGAKQKPDPAQRDRGLRYLQTTDELGAQVALLQSPIPPAVYSWYQLKPGGATLKRL
jgi:hypothetical protein